VRGDLAGAKLKTPTTGEPIKKVKKEIKVFIVCIHVPHFSNGFDLACEIPRKHQNRQMPFWGLFSSMYMILKSSKEFLEEFLKDS